MSKEIIVKLSDGSDVCKIEFTKEFKNRTVTSSKIIKLDDFIKSLMETNSVVEDTIIPQNLAMIKKSGKKTYYFFDFPSQKKHITVLNRSYKPIFDDMAWVPRTIFVIVPDIATGKIRGKDMLVYAAKGTEQLKPDTQLYHLPMYNIFPRDAICWGSYHYDFGDVNSLDKCTSVHSRMYEASCNLDLQPIYDAEWAYDNIPKYRTNSSFIEVLRFLKDEDKFPEGLLVPTNRII